MNFREIASSILINSLSVFGTILAVLSILNLTIENVFEYNTLGGLEKRDINVLKQKEEARRGIALVCCSWILQTIKLFIDVNNRITFLLFFWYGLFFVFGTFLLVEITNSFFKEKYERYKKDKRQKT